MNTDQLLLTISTKLDGARNEGGASERIEALARENVAFGSLYGKVYCFS
jgi:hypothetical protein